MYDEKPLKKKICITLDSDVEKTIKQLTERDDRSFSQYINRVLKKHIEAVSKPRPPVDKK